MIVEIITFVPLLLLVVLFRKTQPLKDNSKRIKRELNKFHFNLKNPKINQSFLKRHKEFRLPWFCKIFFYMLSFILMGISIAFSLFKG